MKPFVAFFGFGTDPEDTNMLDEEIRRLEEQSRAHPLDKSFRDQIKAKQKIKEDILIIRKKQERFGKEDYVSLGSTVCIIFVIGVPFLLFVGMYTLFPLPFKDSKTMLPSLSIIGETNLTSTSPYRLVHDMMEEAKMIWEQKDTEWMTDINTTMISVQSKPVTIEGFSYSLPGQRAVAIVNCTSAQHLYSFMTGPEGFSVIDPYSRKEDFYKPPLRSYSWTHGKLMIEHAITPMIYPYLPREFVVLNVRDHGSRMFGSKSVIYPTSSNSRKTCKVHEANSCNVHDNDENFPVKRAYNTFYMKISNVHQRNTCKMQFVNIIHGLIPHDGFAHYIHTKIFFPQLIERLQAVYPTISPKQQ